MLKTSVICSGCMRRTHCPLVRQITQAELETRSRPHQSVGAGPWRIEFAIAATSRRPHAWKRNQGRRRDWWLERSLSQPGAYDDHIDALKGGDRAFARL